MIARTAGSRTPIASSSSAIVLLLWGANSAETMPPLSQWFARQKERGGKLIVVDPRLTDTARAADLQLPLAPGSDLALASGLLHIAIRERLIDEPLM